MEYRNYNDIRDEIVFYTEKYHFLTKELNQLISETKKLGYDIPSTYERLRNNESVKDVYLSTLSPIDQSKRKIEFLYKDYDIKYGTNWGWCSINKAGCIIDYMEEISKTSEFPICVEIGIYAGKSAIVTANELKRHGKGKLYAIDPWDTIEATKGYNGEHFNFWNSINLSDIYNIFINLVKEMKCEDYVEIIKKPSDEAPEIGNIDFLYIDGQHTDQAIRDVNKYAKNIKLNGYCMVDDINQNVWGEVSTKTPELLIAMGFIQVNTIDDAVVFKRVSIN